MVAIFRGNKVNILGVTDVHINIEGVGNVLRRFANVTNLSGEKLYEYRGLLVTGEKSQLNRDLSVFGFSLYEAKKSNSKYYTIHSTSVQYRISDHDRVYSSRTDERDANSVCDIWNDTICEINNLPRIPTKKLYQLFQ